MCKEQLHLSARLCKSLYSSLNFTVPKMNNHRTCLLVSWEMFCMEGLCKTCEMDYRLAILSHSLFTSVIFPLFSLPRTPAALFFVLFIHFFFLKKTNFGGLVHLVDTSKC